MLKKIKRILKNNNGTASYIEAVVTVIIIMIVIVLAITTYGVIVRKQQAESATSEILRTIEIDGVWNGSEEQKAITTLNNDGFKADKIDCSTVGQITEGDTFTLSLTVKTSFGIGNLEVPVTLKTYQTGHGEKYWKGDE